MEPCASPSSCHPHPEQHALIQKIRRRYNQEVVAGRSAEDEEAARELVQTIAGQAKLLSTELYTKPTHFLLELIQNADDCSYSAGVHPRVLLVLMPDALLHATNETGFTAADVKAICDMSKSTKSRQVGAFTGEKGIGFKATAVASEVTYISSNGYTFAFDMRPDAYDVPCLGLVCPQWEEGLQEHMQHWLSQRVAGCDVSPNVVAGCTTRIWMQLRPDVDRQRLERELQLLNPHMLLNLRKLKDVTVLMVQNSGHSGQYQVKRLVRSDTDSTAVSITVEEGVVGDVLTSSTHHLLCMRHILQVPVDIAEAEDKRQGVDQVEVVFALPMTDDGAAKPDPHAQVFAFLPVRAYGFRFHLQADFLLPSSREGVLENRAWNKWLQQQLGPVFVEQALKAVLNHHQHAQQQQQQQHVQEEPAPAAPDYPRLSPAALLQFLPLPDDVSDDFMAQVSTAILQGLQQHPCVLTASGQLSAAGSTLLPDPLLLCGGGQQLISNQWLQQGLPGKEWVHSDLLKRGDEEGCRASQVLLQLGAQHFSCSLLLEWLGADGTTQLLHGVQPRERAACLQQLYSCCVQLKAQPTASPMHLAADSRSKQLLQAAPIVQLHGSHQLVTVTLLGLSGKQLYMWDRSLGHEAQLQLFSSQGSAASTPVDSPNGAGDSQYHSNGTNTSSSSSSSSSSPDWLCFVDPSTLGPDGEAVMLTLLGVTPVPMSVLVKHMLQQQQCGIPDSRHDQLLLFLMQHASRLSRQDLQALQNGLLLRPAGPVSNSYSPAKQLHLPLSVTPFRVPQDILSDPALQQDLSAAGVAFVGADYECLAGAVQLDGTQDTWQLLHSFGVQQLAVVSAVQHLLQLYSASGGHSSNIRLPDHERHLSFLAHCSSSDVFCLQHVRQGLQLYQSQQDTARESPGWRASELFWPIPSTPGADAMTGQLRLLSGVRLVHPCYLADTAAHELVKSITPRLTVSEVWRRLVDLHSHKDLHTCALTLSVDLQELLLQQINYLAGVRLDLQKLTTQGTFHTSSSSGRASLGGLLLLSSTAQLIPSSQLFIPPADDAASALLHELHAAGCGLQLLHPCFEPCWQDANSEQLLLLLLLGVRQADEPAVIEAIIQLHTSGSADVSEAMRVRHLEYLAQHMQAWRHQHLQQVKDSLLLRDVCGCYHKAAALHMPLDTHFAALQADMCAAGMLFLDSSYTADSESDSGCSTVVSVQRKTVLRSVEDLLLLLGVQVSDANSIACHILKLYSCAAGLNPSNPQHLTHLRFLQERWYDLSIATQQQVSKGLPLLVEAAPAAANASTNSSTGSSQVYAAGCSLYVHPTADSPEAEMLQVLCLGGARFLHSIYDDRGAAGGEDWLPWLKARLGVKVLTHPDAAKHLLSAHSNSSSLVQQCCGAQQVARHTLYIALHGTIEQQKASCQQLLLVLQRTQGCRSKPLYRTAAGPALYYPAAGDGWSLQEVLPPDRVMYLHPVYSDLLAQLQGDASTLHSATLLKSFLVHNLGLHTRPVVGSGALRKAIGAGYCWRPLLLLLRDQWNSYSHNEHKRLLDQLSYLKVETSSGTWSSLDQCFLPARSIPDSIMQLMDTLQLPVLQLPEPDSSRWGFLQEAGVSMELRWPTLHKMLQHLSNAGACPEVEVMQQLYSCIDGLGKLDSRAATEVQAAFAWQALVYVLSTKSQKGCWLSSSEVAWRPQTGCKRLFPHLLFIDSSYKDLESFFTRSLKVRSACTDDLKESLMHFAALPAKEAVEHVRAIYELLAKSSADMPAWLPDLLSHKAVLLVQRGDALFFTSASSSSPIYLPDSTELLELFSQDCCTLAVPHEKLPALKPLLSCIQPPLPKLSASVRRSFAAADSLQRQNEPFWEGVLQQALPLFASCIYYKHEHLYRVLLEAGHLLQLNHLPVLCVPGLVLSLKLGSITKLRPTASAAQVLTAAEAREQGLQQRHSSAEGLRDDSEADSSSHSVQPVLLVDAAGCSDAPRKLLFDVAAAYVDLLFLLAERSSSGVEGNSDKRDAIGAAHDNATQLRGQLRELLKDLVRGDVADAEETLRCENIGHIPPEFIPWQTADSSSSDKADSSSSGSGSEDGGDDISSSGGPDVASVAAGVMSCALAQDSVGSGCGEGGKGTEHQHRVEPACRLPVDGADQQALASCWSLQAGIADMTQKLIAGFEALRLGSETADGWATRVDAAAAEQMQSGGSSREVAPETHQQGELGGTAGAAGHAKPVDGSAAAPAITAGAPQGSGAAAAAGVVCLTEEVVPPGDGVDQAWLSGAVTAAQLAARSGIDLQQLWRAAQQAGASGTTRAVRMPSSYVVHVPQQSAAPAPGQVGDVTGRGPGVSCADPGDSSLHSAAAAEAAACARSSADEGDISAALSREDSSNEGPSPAAESALSLPPGTAVNGQLPAAVDRLADQGAGSGGMYQPTPNWASAQLQDDISGHLKLIGDVGERYVYELFSNVLPGFDGSCWHSGSRQLIGLPAPAVEPSYDFLYMDEQGLLCDRPGAPCYVDVKATTCSLSSNREPKAMEISPSQWELARSLHLHPDQGFFVIVRVDRVGHSGGPRVACILRDPVALLMSGGLWVTAREKLLVEAYPVVQQSWPPSGGDAADD